MGRTACTEPQCLYKGDLYLTLTKMSGDVVISAEWCREFVDVSKDIHDERSKNGELFLGNRQITIRDLPPPPA